MDQIYDLNSLGFVSFNQDAIKVIKCYQYLPPITGTRIIHWTNAGDLSVGGCNVNLVVREAIWGIIQVTR